jgi:hypothetical protein
VVRALRNSSSAMAPFGGTIRKDLSRATPIAATPIAAIDVAAIAIAATPIARYCTGWVGRARGFADLPVHSDETLPTPRP